MELQQSLFTDEELGGIPLEDVFEAYFECRKNLSFSFLYTYNSCFSTLALAGRPLFLVVGLAFET